MEIELEDARRVGWFSHNGKTWHVLVIPARKVHSKKRDLDGVLATEIFSQLDLIYTSPGRSTLNDAQGTA